MATSLDEVVVRLQRKLVLSHFQGEQTLRREGGIPWFTLTPPITSFPTKTGRESRQPCSKLQRRSYNPKLSQMFKSETRKLMAAVNLHELLM